MSSLLAQRLNELAQAHSQTLLTDDEYRILRQNAFESDLNSKSTTPTQPPTTPKLRFLPRLTQKASLFFSKAPPSPPPPPSLNRPSIPSFPPPKSHHKPSESNSLSPPSLPHPKTPSTSTLSTPISELLSYNPDDPYSSPPTSSQIRELLKITVSESERIIEHFEHLEEKAKKNWEKKNARRLKGRTPSDVSEVLAAGSGKGVWRDYHKDPEVEDGLSLPPMSPTNPSSSPSKSRFSTRKTKHRLLPDSSSTHSSSSLPLSRSASSILQPRTHERTPTFYYEPAPESHHSPRHPKLPPSPLTSSTLPPPFPPPSPSKSYSSSITSLLRKASLASIRSNSRKADSVGHSSSKISVDRESRESSSISGNSRSRSGEYDDQVKGNRVKRSLSSSRSTGNLYLLSTSPASSSSASGSLSNRSHSTRHAAGRPELGILTEHHESVNGHEEEGDEEVREVRRKRDGVKKRYVERIEYLKAQLKSAELREKVRRR